MSLHSEQHIVIHLHLRWFSPDWMPLTEEDYGHRKKKWAHLFLFPQNSEFNLSILTFF